ncbi:unnamed protein product [Fraxinus pennsylvanica]|uniref:Uncharacterized protein n=1 Tax=Fraxinus pennsylvanica TaxID=56036 RepID=A0AAD2E9C6_9LAMI|nr:unnamed protein product [Fraxinus pennsylvanica]
MYVLTPLNFIENRNQILGKNAVKDDLDQEKYPCLSFAYEEYKYGNSLPDMKPSGYVGDHDWVIRSVSQWSTGTSQTEDSIHRAYCSLIEEAEKFVYIEVIRSVSQWSTGTSQTEDSIHRAYCSLIEEAENFVYIEGMWMTVVQLRSDQSCIGNTVPSAEEKVRWYKNFAQS